MRFLYTILFYLVLPFVFLRLLWRGRQLPAYRERLPERLGVYSFKLKNSIWIHTVSVGEVIAAVPLIKKLLDRFPDSDILVTTMTPTGSERVKTLLGDKVKHVYLPYDLPFATKRFLKKMNPRICLLFETELWPNLLNQCQKNQIPVCLLNARLSEKSAKGYASIRPLTYSMLNQINLIAAHGHADAKRFLDLGAKKENVIVTGNIKFDLELPDHLTNSIITHRAKLGKNRFIWIAASTHQGEEEQILAAHQKIREVNPQALLLLVPRHPDRFEEIATLSQQSFTTERYTKNETCDPDTAVYLVDKMGILLLMYGVSDVAFVGGSLVTRGGHNILEPAALAKPILSGPHLFNFKEISDLFFKGNALIKVDDAESLSIKVIDLMQNKNLCNEMGERALDIVEANRGALAKQMKLIERVMG